jgi:hypothetical protein
VERGGEGGVRMVGRDWVGMSREGGGQWWEGISGVGRGSAGKGEGTSGEGGGDGWGGEELGMVGKG